MHSKQQTQTATTRTAAKPPGALPDLPFGVTSFGAAIVDQNVYVCGGHLGPAHEYDREGQSDRLLRLDLRSPQRWEVVGSVPRLAGLAMVASGGKIYRIGGFEARNKKDEPADLHSVSDFSGYDPSTGHWQNLASLPQGRSSHDAVVVGSRIYVVGGWELRGSSPSVWHDTALQIDLASPRPEWTELPKPPFRRARWRWASTRENFTSSVECKKTAARQRPRTCSTSRSKRGRLGRSCRARGSRDSEAVPSRARGGCSRRRTRGRSGDCRTTAANGLPRVNSPGHASSIAWLVRTTRQ